MDFLADKSAKRLGLCDGDDLLMRPHNVNHELNHFSAENLQWLRRSSSPPQLSDSRCHTAGI